MKKVFSFLKSPRVAAMDSPTNPGRSGMGTPRPLFRDTDMGAIHKAASVGNVRKVKKILLFRKSGLNDRDRMSRVWRTPRDPESSSQPSAAPRNRTRPRPGRTQPHWARSSPSQSHHHQSSLGVGGVQPQVPRPGTRARGMA